MRSYDLLRSGHIVKALKMPSVAAPNKSVNDSALFQSNSSSDLALSDHHKFDFNQSPTFIVEGTKFFEYYTTKYGYFWTVGFIKISILSSLSLYLCLHQSILTQSDLIDIAQTLRPFDPSNLRIAQSNALSEVCWNTLCGTCLFPIIVSSALYAKIRGEVWENRELRKKPKEAMDLKSDVLTLNNVSSKNKIIYEIALIKERRRERVKHLAPLVDVVDVSSTFSPFKKSGLSSGGSNAISPTKIAEKGMKLRKFMKRHGSSKGLALWLSTSYGAADPRRAGSTQNFGLLQLQTRLDEFGRVIPGWQRQSVRMFAIPTVAIFLFFPPFGDWFLGWTA